MLPTAFEVLTQVDCEHGEFELTDPDESAESLEAWFGAVPSDGSTLTVFATDGTGSLFTLWMRPGVDDIEKAHVIFLGSEGEVTPLALTPDDFIDLVAAQVTVDAYDDECTLHPPEEPADAIKKAFEEALERPMRDPQQIVDAARAQISDLRDWADANNAYAQGG